MLRELITWILNTYLGKYLENFNSAQLSVALLSGEVELENIPIRKDALRSFGIPVQVLSGIIGKIKLQIPVRQFRSAPWCIVVEEVYAVFSPKNPNDWDDEYERLSEFDFKMAELNSKEAIWRSQKGYYTESCYYASSYSNWLNYGTALATNIIENLELKINNVHIRYEDTITIPEQHFTAGLKIGSLSVQSCDSSWVLGSKSSQERDIAYKLIELKDFAVYWDGLTTQNTCGNLISKNLLLNMENLCKSKNHNYIINPITARAECKRERCKLPLRTRTRPRLSCNVLLSEVKIMLTDSQYEQIIGCSSELQNITKIRSFKILRPTSYIIGNARCWWRYAARCYGYKFETKIEKLQKIRENLRYIKIYIRLLINPTENILKDEIEFKSSLEKARTLEELNTMRNVCFNSVLSPGINLHNSKIIKGKSMLYHWFPNWWGWYGKCSNDISQTQRQSVAEEEKFQNIEDEILNALEDSVGNNSYLKRDIVFGYFDFKLADGKFLMCSENTNLKLCETMMEINFHTLNLIIETRPRSGSHFIGLSMGSVCVIDHITTGTKYPNLIKPQAKESSVPPQCIISKSNFISSVKESLSELQVYEPWLQLQYEKRPTSCNSDFRLLIKSKSLDIVYNTNSYQWLINFITSPLHAKREIQTERKNSNPIFFKSWKNLLVENMELRKTWSFEIDIAAPQIIFVDNFTDINSLIVLVDFGRFQLLKNCLEGKIRDQPPIIKVEMELEVLYNESEILTDDEEMFMTPCSTPPGSENSLIESPNFSFDAIENSKRIFNTSTALEKAFRDKIYDKYIIDLIDLQVLICKNTERNFACFKGSSGFNFLDKFSISLELERRIIHTLDPDFPSLAISGTLPKLLVHVNDHKINAVMGMLSLVSINKKNDSRKVLLNHMNDKNKVETDLRYSNGNVITDQSNLIIIHFLVDQMTLEIQSEDRSIAELQVIGVRAGLTKKPEDTYITMSVHGLLFVDAIQSFGQDFELLVASHRHVGMDSISGSLKQSQPSSPMSPASPDPMIYRQATSPHIIKEAIDSIKKGSHSSASHHEDKDALIIVDLHFIEEAVEVEPIQVANIHFNNLDIIANQETIAELIAFIDRVAYSYKRKRGDCDTNVKIKSNNEVHSDVHSIWHFQKQTEISFDFHRLNILVLRELTKDNCIIGRKVGTFTMSEAKIHASLGKDICVTGSLGGMQILDVTPEGIHHQRIFSVGKDPLTNPPHMIQEELLNLLAQDVYGKSSKNTLTTSQEALMFKIVRSKNCVLNIKIRMASVWYTHSVRFITEINWCAFQFQHYIKNFARTIRNKATDMAIGFVQKIHDQSKLAEKYKTFTNDVLENECTKIGCSYQTKFDVILSSPVLILPRSSQSSEVLIANLGKISIYNAEKEKIDIRSKQNFNYENSAHLIYCYIIDIKNINVFSLDTSQRKKYTSTLPKAEEFYSCENDALAILHDTALKLEVSNYFERNEQDSDSHNNAEFACIKGNVTQILKVSLSRLQYEQLLESLDNAIKVPTEVIAPHLCKSKHVVDSKFDGMYSNDCHEHLKQNDDAICMFSKISFSLPILVIALNNEHHNPLIEITFQKFKINYNHLSNIHKNLEVFLGSIIMEDLKCAVDSKYRFMVDSAPLKERKQIKIRVSTSCPNLINSHHSWVSATSIPANLQYAGEQVLNRKIFDSSSNNSSKYDGINKKNSIISQLARCDENLVTYIVHIVNSETSHSQCLTKIDSSIDFNSLNLIISVERWFVVLDFFGLLCENESHCSDKQFTNLQHNECPANENSVIKISVRSLNLILIRQDYELAKANVSHALFKINKSKEYNIIDGRLGSISLFDLTNYGKLYAEKFITSGSEAVNFHYKRRVPISKVQSLERDAVLQIHMSSVRYIHTKRFILEIQSFIKEFLQLQKPVIKKIKLSENKTEIFQRPLQIGLEIKAESPIILLPLCYESNDLIVADLGKFSLLNSFHFASEGFITSKKHNIKAVDEIIDVMQVDLVNINLFAGKRIVKENDFSLHNLKQSFNLGSFRVGKCGNNIFEEKCYLKLHVERKMNSNETHNIPDVTVKGTLSKVSCILSLQQYKVIRGFLAYNLGENIDDVFQNYHFNLCKSFGKINSTLEVNNQKQESSVWKVFSIKIELEDVSVHLNIQKGNSMEFTSLACINFIKSFLEIESFCDGSQDIDLVSSEISITDSRYRSSSSENIKPSNVFFEIIKPIHILKNVVQAEVHSRRGPNCNKYKILLNNMRIIAILDWMECIKDYIGEQTEFNLVEKKFTFHKPHKTTRQNNDANGVSSFEIILNVTDSELVFVEKTDQIDSSSIILKSTTVLSYKPYDCYHPISVNINHLEVFSCILGFEHESALSIIDPVTLNIELQNNQLDILLQKNLCIRLSYHDVKLFCKMLQSITAQTRAAQDKQSNKKQASIDFEIISPLIAMGFNPKDCLYAMEISSNKLNEAAIWLSQQKQTQLKTKSVNIFSIGVIAQFISVCVIDDCKDADVPLLEICLSRLSLSQKLKDNFLNEVPCISKVLSGKLEGIVAADYFNRRLSGWEPILEPWEFMASWVCDTDVQSNYKKSSFNFKVISTQLLKLNITSTLIELCKLVRNNWTQDYYQGVLNVNPSTFNVVPNYRLRTPFVPFVLKNLTGEMLKFKIILSQPGKLTRMEISQRDLVNDWIQVQPNEIIPFKFGPQSKLRHMNSHQLNLHQILVSIAGWDMVGPISIDKVGIFFRYSTEEKFVRRNRIVFDISLMGSAQKMVTVRSALRVFNMLNISIDLKLHNEKHWYTIKPKDCFSVPLNDIGSQIHVKPCHSVSELESHEPQFEFCQPGITCLKSVNELVEEMCACSGPNSASFNILAVIKRDKYPNRDVMHMPGHTILIITPLKITNMLCCDLLFRISGHIAGRIHASECANVYNINIHEALHIRFTLDNYTVSGILRIPSNHSGTVEPKLKLLDMNKRELYLRATIQLLKGRGMEIFISAPVWLVNRTGLPLIYRQEGVLHLASGQFEEHEKARNITPLMFSLSDPDAAPSLEIRLGKRFGENNPWCKSFSVHKEIIYRELQEENGRGNYAIGIEIRRGSGRYSCTNIVTVSPRFQIYNRSSHEIQFAQKCDVLSKENPSFDTKLLTAIPGCHFPFHWPNCDQEPLLCVKLLDIEYGQWSNGIPINEAQSLYINVRNEFGNMFFLRLEVISHGASYFLLFGDAHSLPPPIRIDNYSDVQVNFYQQGCKPQWRTSVRSHFSLAYVLDDPTGYQCLVIEAPGGNTIEFPLHKLEFSRSLTYSNFVYIAFKETFLPTVSSQSNIIHSETDLDNQHLVLGVQGKKVVLMKKCAGDRPQLWLMNSSGQLEHEGSSPPNIPGKCKTKYESRMVLDLEKAPNPMDYTNLVIRPRNKQRETTQTWRFEHGRLMCHANLCVQTRNGVFGLFEGAEAVLGRMESESRLFSKNKIPIEQCIERQKLRPGSGHLQVMSKMDGPILTIQIRDIKTKIMEECLSPDPLWKHTSTIVKKNNNRFNRILDELSIKFELSKGVGISIISRQPYEELIYITLQNLIFEHISTSVAKSIDLKVKDLQIDNQLIDTACPVLLYTFKSTSDECLTNALVLKAKMLQSLNKNAVIIENIAISFKPYIVVLDERQFLKMAIFLGYGRENHLSKNIQSEYEAHYFEKHILSTNSKRYYFENLYIGPCQIRLSVNTATKLSPQLQEMKKSIGLSLIKFEDALIEFDKFTERHHFETIDVYLAVLKMHYKNQIKWQAASILGSVDFLGNPMGFANDLSEGVSGLIFEGSVKSLVRSVTHGISNSTAKLTETLSDSLGRVVLDDSDTETRQKILEISSGQGTSTGHLAAGLKGFGFGLLGGVTSIVRQTYVGVQTDGFHGFISGFGKGLVGTVTKPIIGVLDLASETATAVRETSKGSNHILPARKRWPRCVTGAPGGLLPPYSYRQSKGQQYLYMINRRNLSEHLISYEPNLCNDRDSKLRLLVSTEYVRIFSRCEEDPCIVLDCHLSEVLSCHPLTTGTGNVDGSIKQKPIYYIEISTNLPKITRPRIRCQNLEIAERASRYINYAKSVYDEREQTVTSE